MTNIAERSTASDLESQYTIRPYDPAADLPRLVRLINEMEAVDQVDEGTSVEELHERIGEPEHDPIRDRWVIEEPGNPDRLIADCAVFKGTHSPGGWLVVRVHPDWRQRGLGSALLPRVLARAREMGAGYVNAGANRRVPAAADFLGKHGFHPTATWVEMRTPRNLELAEPEYPTGYTVRTYAEVQDVAILAEALNRGFIGHWEHHEETEESIAHWVNLPSTRPEGIFLAFGPAGDVAGICWTDTNPNRDERRGAPTGYIDSLAVLPEHRRRGLGRALLLTGMRWLEAQGKEIYELGAWGENEMALPLYYGVGYGIAQQGQEYRHDFEGTPAGNGQ